MEETSNGSSYSPVVRKHFVALESGGFGEVDPLTIDFGHRARTLVVDANRLYVGGSFKWVDTPSQSKFNQPWLAAIDLAAGNYGHIITSWKPQANNGVNDVDVLADHNLVVGGEFTALTDGTHSSGGFLGEVDPSGAVLPWAQEPAGRVIDVKVATGDWCGLDPVTDGCILTGLGDVPGQHAANNGAALWDRAGHQLWTRATNGDVQAVGWFAGRAIIGGHFGKVRDGLPLGTVKQKKFAALDPMNGGHLDTSWLPNVYPADMLGGWGIQGYADALYIGGEFTQVRGEPANDFVQFAYVPPTP